MLGLETDIRLSLSHPTTEKRNPGCRVRPRRYRHRRTRKTKSCCLFALPGYIRICLSGDQSQGSQRVTTCMGTNQMKY
eukprot:783596-Prorocentrum_minimum.AAC.1